MSDYDTRRAIRYLPHVVVATGAVVVMPVVVVWWLRARGVVGSQWAGIVLAMALSLVVSLVGSAWWKRRRGPRDLLFGELLVWGWLRRVRMERQLARSMELLRVDQPLDGGDEDMDRTFRILSQLAVALDAQDEYTHGHSRRVAAHATMVARRMGLSSGDVSRVRAAAAVHDIGKVRVPPDVLDKPGRLTSVEFELVKRHADVGAEIVACLRDPEVTAIVRHHHERFDGTGYPSGLGGERIPLGARIVAVVDTFDALTSVRPYRPAAPHKRALDALVKVAGTQLDPVAVRAFVRSYSGNKAIVFWSLLTISPARAVAWLGDKAHAPRNLSLSPTAATVGAITAIAVTAIGAPIGPRPGSFAVRYSYPRAAAAASLASTIGGQRRSRRPGHRRAALPAPRPGHAAQAIGRVSAASGIAAGNSRRGSRSLHSRASASHSRGNSSGGSPSGAAGSSGGGPTGGTHGAAGGGSGGGSGGGPGGGSKGAPGGTPGGGPGGGSKGAPGGGSRRGSSGASGSSGGRGPRRPSTKDQCKDRGYVQYGFPNQGRCVAFVERGSR